jgi:hypothetical protein
MRTRSDRDSGPTAIAVRPGTAVVAFRKKCILHVSIESLLVYEATLVEFFCV